MTEPEYPTRGCAKCGYCCEAITMVPGFDPTTFQADPGSDEEADIAFILQHWTKTADATSEQPWSTWSCDKFDLESRECTAYDDRPPVCSNYPWYGKPPTPERAARLHGCCSYLGDVLPSDRPDGAWPLIPIEVIRR